ncbi:hypothetical protein D3C86_601310 [compost metagenome]
MMSASKRLLFGNNSIDAPVRSRMRAEAGVFLAPFVHRLPLRRRNPVGLPYWDPLWPLAIEEAVQSIGAECGAVNGGFCSRPRSCATRF